MNTTLDIMTITIEPKTVYGKEMLYVTSHHADYIETLTGKKTVDRADLKALKALGFEFEIESSFIL